MSLRSFMELVDRMRQAQRTYFMTPKQSTLLEARRLEQKVDEAIRKVCQEYEQARMFQPPEHEQPPPSYDPRELHLKLSEAAQRSLAYMRQTTLANSATPSVDERQEQRHR